MTEDDRKMLLALLLLTIITAIVMLVSPGCTIKVIQPAPDIIRADTVQVAVHDTVYSGIDGVFANVDRDDAKADLRNRLRHEIPIAIGYRAPRRADHWRELNWGGNYESVIWCDLLVICDDMSKHKIRVTWHNIGYWKREGK